MKDQNTSGLIFFICVYLWLNFLNEINLYFVRDDAGLVAFGEEAFDGFAAAIAVVEREVIDPHRDKAVCESGLHIACELHCIRQSVFAVVQRIDNRSVEML